MLALFTVWYELLQLQIHQNFFSLANITRLSNNFYLAHLRQHVLVVHASLSEEHEQRSKTLNVTVLVFRLKMNTAMRTLVNWLRLHGTLLPHRNGHLWLTHSKRLINEHLLLVLLHVHVVWQLPLTLIVGGLLLWLVTGLYWNWHLHLLVLTLMSRSHILLIVLRLLISAKLSLILIVSFIWWSRVCLFLLKFLIAMSKWAFLTIGTHTLLEIFTKFCLIISTALWWDERFIEILLLHALILIASKEVTLASSRGLSHLHRVLKSTTAIVSHATSASTVEVVVTATASSLVIVINTSATIIRNLTLMLVGLHEVSLVELWLLSLNLTSWGVIVLEASLIWHLLSIHLISLVLEASWSTTSSISSHRRSLNSETGSLSSASPWAKLHLSPMTQCPLFSKWRHLAVLYFEWLIWPPLLW